MPEPFRCTKSHTAGPSNTYWILFHSLPKILWPFPGSHASPDACLVAAVLRIKNVRTPTSWYTIRSLIWPQTAAQPLVASIAFASQRSLSASVSHLTGYIVRPITKISTPLMSHLCSPDCTDSRPAVADEQFCLAELQHVLHVCQKNGLPTKMASQISPWKIWKNTFPFMRLMTSTQYGGLEKFQLVGNHLLCIHYRIIESP